MAPQHPPTTVPMPPDYSKAWQLPMPTINPANLNAPPTQLPLNIFSDIVPPAPFPHAIDNKVVHLTIAHCRGGLPRERASRTAPFYHPTTTKRGNGRCRAPYDNTSLMVFIPHNTSQFLDKYHDTIWTTIFGQSLLLFDDEIKMAVSAWATVIKEQNNGTFSFDV